MVWLDADRQWQAPASGRPGRSAVLSDAAMQFCLTFKCIRAIAITDNTIGDAPLLPELLARISADTLGAGKHVLLVVLLDPCIKELCKHRIIRTQIPFATGDGLHV